VSAPMRVLTPRQESMKLTLKQVSLPWAIYIRVSTKDQGEKYSPASQRATLLRLAEEIGVSVPENFILLDKQTGKNEDRADFQRLMKLAIGKQIGGALVLELSRVARNVVDAIEFRKMLKREGAALAFALQQFDDTPQGRMMYNNFATYAEYEGELILQRTCKGRLQKAKEGKIQDPHTFGYLYHPEVRLTGGKIQDSYIEPHPTEAQWVVWMFEDYAKNGSAYGLQKRLNEAGILTKRGNPWAIPTVLKLLRNPIYTGDYVTTVKGEDFKPEEVKIETPKLIDRALWNKVQVKLAEASKRAGRPPKHRLLAGLLECICILPSGKPCKRHWGGWWKGYYSCTNTYDHFTRKKLCIDSKPVRDTLMERLVLDGLRDKLRDPEMAYTLAKEHHAETTRAKSEGPSVDVRLARLKQRYERAEAIVFSDMPQRTRDKAAQQLKEIEQEQRALEVEASEAAVVVLPSKDRIVYTCERMRKGLDGLQTFDEKRAFLLKTVERVETDGRDYVMYCRIELAPADAAAGGRQKRKLDCGPVDYFAFVIRGKVA
jgi:site-specific DNA recombinase